jgi:hypothetical protein
MSNTCFISYEVDGFRSIAYVRFEVLIGVNMKITIFKDVILLSG